MWTLHDGILYDNVDKWDYRDVDSLFHEDAVTREACRSKWRDFYKMKAVFDLRQIRVVSGWLPPVRPDQLDDPILEPPEKLEEFLSIIQETFQAASTVYLEDLHAFSALPCESLIKLADRFDEVSLPLLTAGLMTSRGLALTLRRHIPMHIRRTTLAAMMREDEKRYERGALLVDKDELMAIAQRKEGFLLEFEAEMRAAGQVPDPRPVSDDVVYQATPPRPPRPMGDRGGNPRDVRDVRDVRDRLGNKPDDTPPFDTRECHNCKKVGHIAKNCTAAGPSALPKPPVSRPDATAAHKTAGAVCESCGKPGHTMAHSWSVHPELVPEALMKKRQSAMSTNDRKRQRAAEYISPNYRFQGMALTY